MYIYTLEINLTLVDGSTIDCVMSDGDTSCPIDVRNAKSTFKKELAAFKTGKDLVSYITSLCDDKDILDDDPVYQDFCSEACDINDSSNFKRLDIEIREGELDGEAYRGRLGYDFTTGKGSKSYREIDSDDLF